MVLMRFFVDFCRCFFIPCIAPFGILLSVIFKNLWEPFYIFMKNVKRKLLLNLVFYLLREVHDNFYSFLNDVQIFFACFKIIDI